MAMPVDALAVGEVRGDITSLVEGLDRRRALAQADLEKAKACRSRDHTERLLTWLGLTTAS